MIFKEIRYFYQYLYELLITEKEVKSTLAVKNIAAQRTKKGHAQKGGETKMDSQSQWSVVKINFNNRDQAMKN